jgi:Xaa-Pro aminopeptidase
LVFQGKKLTVYSQRREKLLSLAKGKQVVALTAPNLFYLTDFFGAAAAIVHPDKTVVLASPLEADRADEVCREAEVVVVKRLKEVRRTLEKLLGKGKVIVDSDEPRLDSGRFIVKRDFFLEARRAKDETEIERIRKACAKTDKVFEVVEGELKPGRTEWQIAAEAMKVATEEGMTPSNSDSSLGPIIIASGPHGAHGHSELSGRRVESGDFVVADLFFRFEGYNSDETRTFAVGTIDADMKRHYAVVREAQRAALDAAKVGVQCGKVHDAAVEVLRKNGVDKYLNHSVGHGVGIDIHEMPGIYAGNRVRLEKNDVITDEPGIYLVGKYGIRIEDTLVVGKEREVLTNFTKDLVTCS